MTLHHDSTPDTTVNSAASISDPAVSATGGFTVFGAEGSSAGSQTVAVFSDPGGPEALVGFSASIAWGRHAEFRWQHRVRLRHSSSQ